MLILDLLSVFRLQGLDPFLVLQLSTDFVTINFPDMVDGLPSSCPHLTCSPFLYIVENMVSQGTAQPLFLII